MESDYDNIVLQRVALQRASAFVPEGWTLHDGTGCPVDRTSSPAVIFRDGQRVEGGLLRADTWEPNWTWEPDTRNRGEIVAYRVD